MQLIALGSSVRLAEIGEPPEIVRVAIGEIGRRIGSIQAISRLYGTRAWPDPSQPSFINAAMGVETALSPTDVLDGLLEIELEFGRQRSAPNAPRTLDLDVIASGDLCLETSKLILPHPRMHLRDFVLEPLCDVAPDWMHPGLGKTARTLLAEVQGQEGYDPTGIWVHQG